MLLLLLLLLLFPRKVLISTTVKWFYTLIFYSLEIKDVGQYLVSRLCVGTSVETKIIINDSHFMYVEEYTFLLFQNIRDNIIIDSVGRWDPLWWLNPMKINIIDDKILGYNDYWYWQSFHCKIIYYWVDNVVHDTSMIQWINDSIE